MCTIIPYFLLFLVPFFFFSIEALYAKPVGKDSDLSSQQTRTLEVTLGDLAVRYDGFLLDAYGVFWASSDIGVYPEARAAMKYLVSQGKQVGILSNATQLSAKEKEKFKKHGLYEGVHYHFILTSGEVSRQLLIEEGLPFSTPRHTYWVFGSPHPRFGSPHLQIFEGTGYRETKDLQEADFIYISIPHLEGEDQENPEVFRALVEAVGVALPVLCINPDRFSMEGIPPHLVVRQGSIAQMFVDQKATVYFMGKPFKEIYDAALKRFPQEIEKRKVVMIGDTPETDILGAHRAGLDAVLVTKTGVLSALLEKEGVFSVIHRLPSQEQPDFFMQRLSEN